MPTARDLVTVDLRGMKPALIERGRGAGVSASRLVRQAVAELLRNRSAPEPGGVAPEASSRDGRVRVSLRLSRSQYDDLHERAATAGLPFGSYVISLMCSSTEPLTAFDRAARTAALVRSNANLPTLSRDIAQLTGLLR